MTPQLIINKQIFQRTKKRLLISKQTNNMNREHMTMTYESVLWARNVFVHKKLTGNRYKVDKYKIDRLVIIISPNAQFFMALSIFFYDPYVCFIISCFYLLRSHSIWYNKRYWEHVTPLTRHYVSISFLTNMYHSSLWLGNSLVIYPIHGIYVI